MKNLIVFFTFLLVAVFGLCLFVVFLSVISRDSQAASIPPATPAPVLHFEDVRVRKGDLTDLQWQEYQDSLEGKRAESWVGTITKVSSFAGRHSARVDMGWSSDDVILYIEKDVALLLEMNSQVIFSGAVSGTRDKWDGFSIVIRDAEMH